MTFASGSEFDEALGIALRMLRASDKIESEIRRRLEERGVPTEVSDSVLEHLRRKRILDDSRLAAALVERNSGKRAKGAARLRSELAGRGAPIAAVEEAFAGMAATDLETMLAALRAKLRAGDSPKKAWRFLVGRGFDPDEARDAVEAHFRTVLE